MHEINVHAFPSPERQPAVSCNRPVVCMRISVLAGMTSSSHHRAVDDQGECSQNVVAGDASSKAIAEFLQLISPYLLLLLAESCSSDFSKSASSPEVRIQKMRRPFVLFEPRVSFKIYTCIHCQQLGNCHKSLVQAQKINGSLTLSIYAHGFAHRPSHLTEYC